MAQRTSNLALAGAAAGGLALIGAASDAFVAVSREATAPGLRGATAAQAQAQTPGSASSALPALACGGAVAAAAVATGRQGRQTRSSLLPTTVVPVKESAVTRRALDQSSRYADLSLDEATLIRNGKHVLVAYIMKPKAGYDYLATAAHFAAESSTGTNVNVCTTDDFTKSVDALVYYIDPDSEEMKIAYPNLLFDRNIIDGRGMMCSFLTLAIGNNQGMGDVEYGKIYDFYMPPAFLRLYDGPAVNVEDMWRILGKGTQNGGLVVGTIIKPKLGLQPKPFGEACYAFWQGGDFIKNDEPQGNQVFCQMNECIPEVVKAMRAAIKETGNGKLFSANITADDPNEMIARGKYCLSQFGPLSENCAFLVDGYVAGGTAVTCARRNFPKQFLHYHRAGHGSVTSPQTQRGYTAFVHTKISRVIGASGIHTGAMSFGKMEGDASDKNIAFMLQDDEEREQSSSDESDPKESTSETLKSSLADKLRILMLKLRLQAQKEKLQKLQESSDPDRPSDRELSDFCNYWRFEETTCRFIAGLPGKVQKVVIASFAPPPTTACVDAMLHKYAKSILERSGYSYDYDYDEYWSPAPVKGKGKGWSDYPEPMGKGKGKGKAKGKDMKPKGKGKGSDKGKGKGKGMPANGKSSALASAPARATRSSAHSALRKGA